MSPSSCSFPSRKERIEYERYLLSIYNLIRAMTYSSTNNITTTSAMSEHYVRFWGHSHEEGGHITLPHSLVGPTDIHQIHF